MICDVGAGALTPLDETGLRAGTACPVDQARRQMEQATAGSCGQEVFCREGTRQILAILTDISNGRGVSADLELIEELCAVTADVASCDMAATAARRTLDLLTGQQAEWELHLRRKRCTSLTCATSATANVAATARGSTGAGAGMTRRRRRGETRAKE